MPFREWPTWLKFVSFAAVAFVLAWGGWMALRDTLCTVRPEDLLLKRPIRGACFEFWLNRYQSLIGNALTAAIAGITLIWVAKQMKASNRQAAVATADILALRLRELELERQEVGDNIKAIVELCSLTFGMGSERSDLLERTTRAITEGDRLFAYARSVSGRREQDIDQKANALRATLADALGELSAFAHSKGGWYQGHARAGNVDHAQSCSAFHNEWLQGVFPRADVVGNALNSLGEHISKKIERIAHKRARFEEFAAEED